MPEPPARPAAPIPRPLATLLVPFYRLEISRRNRAFDRGRGVTRLDRPVISVGNLSVGGTGKTPMVRRLLGVLLGAGHNPCVAMRGYKATARREADEADAHRRAFPGVPVVAQPDRIAGLGELFKTEPGGAVDCVVLDDGFQHRKLARDLDIVLVDTSHDPFADRLLPAGWLREPVGSLARAHAVVITHTELGEPAAVDALGGRIERAAPQALTARARHAWRELRVVDEGAETIAPCDDLAERRIVAVCAIGNPGGFMHALCAHAGREPVGSIVLQDHDPYPPQTVARIVETAERADAEVIVTTDKDWSKLKNMPPETWPCPIMRPVLEMRFDSGRAELERLVLDAVRR